MSTHQHSHVLVQEGVKEGVAAASPSQSPRRRNQRKRHDALTGWMFLAPFAILFILVFIIPIAVAIQKAFFRDRSGGGGLYGGGERVSEFVGFENFSFVIHSDAFWTGMGRMVLFGLFQIPVMILFALALALLLDSFLVKHVGFFRLGNFMPYAIPGVIAAMVWAYLYHRDLSPIVAFLEMIGIHDFDFGSRNVVLFSMANMTTWTFTGYNMLIFLAALQAIPHDLYEAARIDGATGWQITTRIKIPMVSSAALLAVLLSIIGTVQLFNEPTIMATQNNWMGADYAPMMMAYNTMMGQLNPSGDGPASAISIVMALIAGVLAIIYALVQNKLQK